MWPYYDSIDTHKHDRCCEETPEPQVLEHVLQSDQSPQTGVVCSS